MGYKQTRKIVRFGAVSRGVVVPKGWLEFYDFQEGDRVIVLGDSILIVCHPHDEQKARRILGLIEQKWTQAGSVNQRRTEGRVAKGKTEAAGQIHS